MCSRNERKNVTGFIDQNATNVELLFIFFWGSFHVSFFAFFSSRIPSSFLPSFVEKIKKRIKVEGKIFLFKSDVSR